MLSEGSSWAAALGDSGSGPRGSKPLNGPSERLWPRRLACLERECWVPEARKAEGTKLSALKKILTFDRRPEVLSLDNGRSSAGDGGPGDLIQNKDLGKMHKAASVGDAAKAEEMLLLQKHGVDDRDKMSR